MRALGDALFFLAMLFLLFLVMNYAVEKAFDLVAHISRYRRGRVQYPRDRYEGMTFGRLWRDTE